MRALYGLGARVPWSRVFKEHRVMLLPLGVILLANLGVLGGLVLPLSARAAANEQRAIASERQRAVAQAELTRAESLRDGKAQATTDLETFYRDVLPADVTAARRMLQLRLQQRAREHDVRFESGGTTEEVLDKSTLLRLTTQMRLSGEYRDIRAFIYDVEHAEEFVVIDNVRLSEGVDENAPLAVALQVSTYYRASARDLARTAADGR